MIYFLFEFNCNVGTKESQYIHSFCEDIEYHAKENKILGRMNEYQKIILTDNEALIKRIKPLEEKCKKIEIHRTSKTDILELDVIYKTK